MAQNEGVQRRPVARFLSLVCGRAAQHAGNTDRIARRIEGAVAVFQPLQREARHRAWRGVAGSTIFDAAEHGQRFRRAQPVRADSFQELPMAALEIVQGTGGGDAQADRGIHTNGKPALAHNVSKVLVLDPACFPDGHVHAPAQGDQLPCRARQFVDECKFVLRIQTASDHTQWIAAFSGRCIGRTRLNVLCPEELASAEPK